MRRSKEPVRIDKRKVPKLFRAVERDVSPHLYYGQLISDDGFNIVFFGAHGGRDTHFVERIIRKNEYQYSPIDKDDFAVHTRRGIYNMDKEAADQKLQYEAAVHKYEYAKEKLKEMGI